MTLFEDIIIQSLGPTWKNAKQDISIIRDLLNDWFLHYPEKEKSELNQDFKRL